MQFIDLAAQQSPIKDALDKRIQSVMSHGKYIMGPEVFELEKKLSQFCGCKYAITCANGTDALQLALMALKVGVGDAIFVPSFTFAATAEIIPPLGATPIFVDVNPETFNMDVDSLKRCILLAVEQGLKPVCIIPVDLFGLPADYDAIYDVAHKHEMTVISDSAQGFGSLYKGKKSGTLGHITTTSFFPAKPLGCYGDGGAIFTDNEDWANTLSSLRFHGKGQDKYDNIRLGINSRLDTFQAAILLEKLAIYPEEINKRLRVAENYNSLLAGVIEIPIVPNDYSSVWAQYTLKAKNSEERSQLMVYLKEQDIPTVIYYPLPLHKQSAYKSFPTDPTGCRMSELVSEQVFSIPMHPYLSLNQQKHIADVIRSYFNKS
jgi:dTDP-4-amino-4,6-dideoxygalactose transaminase